MLVDAQINLNTKFDMYSFTNFSDVIGAPKFKSGSRDPDHAHLGVVCNPKTNT